MKKIFLLMMAVCSLICFGSCIDELDNYEAPNGGIKGTILDAETNQPIPLPVQGSNGAVVKLYEQNTGATQSIDFRAKMDGTYENSQVFNCEYKIVVEGPFAQPCEDMVTVHGQTVKDLKTIPYARIEANASVSGRVVTINYNVDPTDASYNVSEVYGYWNFAPGVDDNGSNRAGKVTVSDTQGSITLDLSNDATFLDNLYKIKANNNKIYVRVGAKTEGKINYSTIIELTIQ